MQTLRFDSVYGAGAPLWEGSYALSLAGEAYAAECRFRIVDDQHFRYWGKQTCTGDEVYLLWLTFGVAGITLPQRLSTVRVRLVRNGSTLHDATVSQTTSCDDFDAASEASGVCVFVEARQ